MKGLISFPEFSSAMLLVMLLILGLATGWSMVLASRRLAAKPVRKYAVILLNFFAAVALIGLLADIRIAQPQVSQAMLLTRGSLPLTAQQQQTLATQPQTQLYVMQDIAALLPDRLQAAKVIATHEQILDWQPRLQRLTVVGDGLSAPQWQHIRTSQPELKIEFMPAALVSGFTHLRWPKQLIAGQSFELSGQIQLADAAQQEADLYAVDVFDPMGNKLAEQSIRQGQTFNFSLQAPIKGKWLYQLQLRPQSSTRTNSPALASEQFAVAVQTSPLPSVLIVQSAPSFETRQIKAWAGSFGSRVTVLSQISKNNFLTQHVNAGESLPRQIKQLEAAELSEFDLFIIDSRAISGLSEPQWFNLTQRVKQGAGLLILADGSLQATLAERDPELGALINISRSEQAGDIQLTRPVWPHSDIEQAIAVQPLTLSISRGDTLVEGAQQQALVSRVALGLGQVAVSLINNSYQWQTAGFGRQYSHYWQYLFSKLAANPASAYWLAQSDSAITQLQQSDTACAISQLAGPQAELQANQNPGLIRVALNPDVLQQERYCATYWPVQTGWQKLTLLPPGSDTSSPVQEAELLSQARYVYGEQEWQAWQQQGKQQASYAAAQQSRALAEPAPQLHSYSLNKLWSWLLLLLCLSLLWLERKRF